MREEELQRSLEELFSDVPPPTPPGKGGRASAPPEAEKAARPTLRPRETLFHQDIQTWRQQFALQAFRVLAVLGFLALVAGSYYTYVSGNPWLIPIYLTGYILVVVLAFAKGVTYPWRAWGLMALIYGLAVVDLIDSGRGGDGRVFLLALPLLAVLLFGRREGILALVVDMLTMALFGWLYASGRLTIPVERQANTANPFSWASNAMIMLALGVPLVLAQGGLIVRLYEALTHSRKLTDELEEQRRQLEAQRSDLEAQQIRLQERTRALQEANYALQRRAIHIEASAEIGRVITSIFDLDQLLRQAVELIRERFGFYYVGIFFMDDAGEYAVLREATGDIGAQLKARNYRLRLGEGMVGWSALHRQPRIALDVKEDAVYLPEPLLSKTRSAVALPLMVSGRLLGVLEAHSLEEGAFDSDDVRALQGMADQIVIAIENARRVSEDAALLEATNPLYRAGQRLTQALSIDDVVNVITSIVAETEADGCVVGLFEPLGSAHPVEIALASVWRRDRRPSIEAGTRVEASADLVAAYSSAWVADDLDSPQVPEQSRPFLEGAGVRAVANFPIMAGDTPLGFFLIYRTQPGAPGEAALRRYQTLATQAAVAIERVRLLQVTRQQALEESTLRLFGDRLAQSLDIEALLREAAEELGRALDARAVVIEMGPVLADQPPRGEAGAG